MHPTGTSLYFAYGSNLYREALPAGLLRPVGPAWLPDRAVAFTKLSKRQQGGVLDVVPRRGAYACGALFEVGPEAWAVLDAKEGPSYEVLDLTVLTPDGEARPARTYAVRPDKRRPFVAPSEAYLARVREGLATFGHDAEALEAAAQGTEGAPNNALFVYGTLMRGESRYPVLSRAGVATALLAETQGRLLDLGSYPGLVELGAEASVQGDFVVLEAATEALFEALDAVEGFHGYGQPGLGFERRLVWVHVGDGRLRLAWTYVHRGQPGAPVIASGDWRAHQGRREAFLEALAAAHCGGLAEEALAAALAGTGPFPMLDRTGAALAPLAQALGEGRVSERALAQVSGRWAVEPGPARG